MVSASRPDGFTAPKSTSATAPPPAWPSSQPSTIAGTRSASPDRRTHAAVGEHDDGARVRRDHRVEQRELRGGQLDVVAVEALGLLRGRQAEEQHDGRRRPRRAATASAASSSDVGAVGAVAGRERHLGAVAGERADLVERVVEPRRVDQRGAGALVARRAGELADHGDAMRPTASGSTSSSFFSSTIDAAAASRASAWWASTS